MRSWRSGWRRRVTAGLVVLGVAACGSDTPPDDIASRACETSFLSYDNFGAPFVADWCRGCHSSMLPADMRQGSPPGVNFDTADQVRDTRARI